MRCSRSGLWAIAALAAGCSGGGSDSTGPAPVTFTPGPATSGQGFVALYAPPLDVGPYPNDLYNPSGNKLDVPERITSPLASALNTLDGFSTTAVVSAPFNAPLDAATLVPFDPLAPTGAESVFVLDTGSGVPLVPGVDYDVRIGSAAGTGGGVLEIVPLKPLRPRTRYVFILTDRIRSTAGVAASADTVFAAVRDAHLAGLTSVPGAPQLDPLFAVIVPLLSTATATLGLPGESVVAAWSMLTQSITDVLDVIEQSATPRTALLESAGITTAELGVGLPGLASIYSGFIQVPYYGDPANPLTSFWINASFQPLTGADPTPLARVAELRIPLLATLPNEAAGATEPAGGRWPVVVFQHGVTLNRTAMLAIADAFAQAGFAVIAIDLPLHGVTDTSSPFYQSLGGALGTNERHFNLDNVGATGVFAPDGEIDDGWQILNLQNPLNARDHARQAVADTIHLVRTIGSLNFADGDADPDLDPTRIHYVGVSLGSIISGVFLGLDSQVRTATLASPAGPWTAILTDPEALVFGAPIRAGLSAQGLPLGTAGFDNFVRDLQTLLDPVDPVNYAAAAAANHPLHALEVLGDTAVPNAPTEYLAALWGLSSVSATVAVTLPATTSGIVRFNAGEHSSFLDPASNPAVTTEMQRQAVVFAASDGSIIQVTDDSILD